MMTKMHKALSLIFSNSYGDLTLAFLTSFQTEFSELKDHVHHHYRDWHAYILKARVQTPQTICNFPQIDCLENAKTINLSTQN